MKNGETYFDGCNQIGCEDGEWWTTDADCSCYLEDGARLDMNDIVTMDDGCTVCLCVAWSGLGCDASACPSGHGKGYCSNGMGEGEVIWYGCNGIECRDGEIWELDGECHCQLEGGRALMNGEKVTLEDGCTICSCSCSCGPDAELSLGCDGSACEI
jgi:hypothetical protein